MDKIEELGDAMAWEIIVNVQLLLWVKQLNFYLQTVLQKIAGVLYIANLEYRYDKRQVSN